MAHPIPDGPKIMTINLSREYLIVYVGSVEIINFWFRDAGNDVCLFWWKGGLSTFESREEDVDIEYYRLLTPGQNLTTIEEMVS